MKKAATLLALFCIAAFAQQKGTFTDTRDGKKYKTTKIGTQTWMAENLNYKVEGSKCYNDSISYCDKYGRLYNLAEAMKACPKGWHLPSDKEWDKLLRFVDGNKDTNSPYESKTAGKYLKATSGWNDYEGKSGNGEDKFGFSALPGGYSGLDDYFSSIGKFGGWWSSSEYNSDCAYTRNIYYNDEYANYNCYGNLGNTLFGFSVRCVRD